MAADLGITIGAAIVVYVAAFVASQNCTTTHSCGPVCPPCSHIEPAVAVSLAALFVQSVLLVIFVRRVHRVIWAVELIGVCVLVVVMFDY